jgi:uncharacterized membrane protein
MEKTLPATQRIPSIDILRGLIMVIMALDHVRDFFCRTPFRPEDLTQTSVPLFFTRWITHFCAPTFIFLSGVSIFLLQQRKPGRRHVSLFLVTRGLWLVAVEIVVISFSLQFGYQLIILTVFWVIGWSMVFMAAFIWLPRWLLITLAIIIIGGHDALPTIANVTPQNAIAAVLHNSPFLLQLGKQPVLVAYTIFPWAGVMLAGYLIGSWFSEQPARRDKLLITAGIAALVLFVVLRGINLYGDPAPWSAQPRGIVYTVLSFVNVSKYPPSWQFISLTVGVGLILLYVFNHGVNRATSFVQVYGRVPFFYYLLHLPLIHISALLWTYLAFGMPINLSLANPEQYPATYHPSLMRAYLAWILIVAVLYFPCRWFGRYRREKGYWWLSYL